MNSVVFINSDPDTNGHVDMYKRLIHCPRCFGLCGIVTATHELHNSAKYTVRYVHCRRCLLVHGYYNHYRLSLGPAGLRLVSTPDVPVFVVDPVERMPPPGTHVMRTDDIVYAWRARQVNRRDILPNEVL